MPKKIIKRAQTSPRATSRKATTRKATPAQTIDLSNAPIILLPQPFAFQPPTAPEPEAPTPTLVSAEPLVGVDWVVERLGYSGKSKSWGRGLVYRLAKQGILPSVRLGRAVRFDPKAIEEFVKRGGGSYASAS